MAPRQLCCIRRRPLSFAVSLISFCLFSAPNLRGRSSPNFDTCSMVARIYKTRSEICSPALLKSIWRPPKHQNLGANFGPLRNLIANISVTKQTPSNEKVALQTEICPAHAHALNLNFGPQTAKNRTGGDTTDPTRSRCVGHVS